MSVRRNELGRGCSKPAVGFASHEGWSDDDGDMVDGILIEGGLDPSTSGTRDHGKRADGTTMSVSFGFAWFHLGEAQETILKCNLFLFTVSDLALRPRP